VINICSNVALVRVPAGATYSASEGSVPALTWAAANVREWFATGALAPACLLGRSSGGKSSTLRAAS
jgi:hypothetical protein